MTFGNRQTTFRSLLLLLFGALAISLAACGESERPSGESIGRSIDQTGEKLASAGQAVDNTALAARVKAALIAAPGLKSARIDVDAANGVVTLVGTAENPDKRDLAEQLASNVAGVASVRNQIVVASGS